MEPTTTNAAWGLAVVGNEVYVGDKKSCSIHIFSVAGVHLREIRGDWRQPRQLVHFDGRIYLTEHTRDGEEDEEEDAEDEEWCEERKRAGKRIFVLTPEGQTLQVWYHGTRQPEIYRLHRMAIFGRKLLVSIPTYTQPADGVADTVYGRSLLALKGI